MSLFARLFPRRRPTPEPAAACPPPPPPASLLPASAEIGPDHQELAIPHRGAARANTVEAVEAAEDLADLERDVLDSAASGGETHLQTPADIRRDRAAMTRLALSGPHKITPNDPVGPGSLAEALMALDAQGEVHAQVIEDEDVGFCILYAPAMAGLSDLA